MKVDVEVVGALAKLERLLDEIALLKEDASTRLLRLFNLEIERIFICQ